jgi:hypothetical protein
MDDENLITQMINEGMFSTVMPDVMSSDGLYTNAFDLTTSDDDTNIIIEEQWFNVNQSYRRDSYRPFLSWKRTGGNQKFESIILLFIE